MLVTLLGSIYDGLPLIPLAVAFVWTLRYQKVADLSLAGSFSVSASCCAYLLNSGYGSLVSIIAGIFIGLFVGLAMGFAVNILRIEPLLSGLVILFITYALSLGITQGTIHIEAKQNPLEAIFAAEGKWNLSAGAHPAVNLIFLLVASLAVVLTTYLLASEWGCAFRALEDITGGRLLLGSLGLSPLRLSSIGFGIAGILASASGILIALRDRQTTSSFGLETLIEIIPAYILGIALFERRPTLQGGSLNKGSGFRSPGNSILRAVRYIKSLSPAFAAALGVLLFFFVINLVQRGAVFSWVPRVLIGLILIAILGIRPAIDASNRHKRQARHTTVADPDRPLEISGLTVCYPTTQGPKHVLRDVSISVQPKEVVQLKGPNGCGKSTLLRALADRVDCAGAFTVPAHGNSASSPQRAQIISYVPQNAEENIAATLSIAEHAVLSERGHRVSAFRRWKRSASRTVSELGVDDVVSDSTTLLRWLSGGQKRRVLIGLLALRNPRPVVVALDEPFNDLDAAGRAHCARVLRKLSEEGCAMLLVDHQGQFSPTRIEDKLWLQEFK